MIVETVMEVVDKGMGLLRVAMFKAFSSEKPNTGKDSHFKKQHALFVARHNCSLF